MRHFNATLTAFAAIWMLAWIVPGTALGDDHGQEVLAKFTDHVSQQADVSAETKTAIESILKDNADDPQYAITEALVKLFPQYAKAIESTDGDDVEQAIELLTPLTESEHPYLAADASFYLARKLMNSERYEAAMPLLDSLTGKAGAFTAHQGSAQYYIGVAQAGLLQNDKAIESFMQFLQFNPDAAERLRVSAWRQVQQLQSIQEGKLSDVYRRMDYSRRRLELIETNETTQLEQDKIVKMLTQLIKEEEKKECSNCKGGKCDKPGQKPGSKQAESKPSESKSQSGGSSSNPNGKAVVKSYDDSPASPWSRLRDRSRDPANNAVKEKLPARYRAIVEKYIEKANGGK